MRSGSSFGHSLLLQLVKIAIIVAMTMEDVKLNMLALLELVKYQEAAFLNRLEDHVQEHQESVKIVTLS